jgi:preprotein translocase SecF subunit
VKPLRLVPDDTNLPFMKWVKYRTPVSLFLIVVSFVLFFTVGVNVGIDFIGGTAIEVQSRSETADVGQIRADLSTLELGEVQVQTIDDARTVLIRIATQPGGEAAQQRAIDLVRATLSEDEYLYRSTSVVGPRVSSELATTGTLAIIFTIIGIMAYIWLRFEWQFAIGAVATLVHDAILMVGFFAATQIDFNLTSIAAILTVIGYSLNDTVVIFDRIREVLRKFKQMPIRDVINLATNQTLARTIMTSLTLLLSLGALYFFGGQVIRSFTASMIWGVFIATASSIFIGGPLLVYFNLRPAPTTPGPKDDEKLPVPQS